MVGTGRFEWAEGGCAAPVARLLFRLRCAAATNFGVLVIGEHEMDLRRKEILPEILMVGTGRFELPTPRTPSECSTRLSHVPTRKELKAPTWRAELGLTFQFYTTASPPPSPNYASIPSLMRPSGLMRVGSHGGSHTTFSFTVFTPGMLRIVVFTSRPISTCEGQPWAVSVISISTSPSFTST